MPPIDPTRLEERIATLDRCIRKRNTYEYLGCAAVVVLFGLQAVAFLGNSGGGPADMLMGAGAAVVALGAILVAIQIRQRAAPLRQDDRNGDPLSAHLRQLERQRGALKTAWLWYVGPLLPGFLLIYAGQALRPGTGLVWPLASAVVTVAVLIAIALVNRRAARGFGEEIGRLEAMQRQS